MLSIDRLLTFLILLALVGAAIALGYIVTNPLEGDFTEFYIVGPGGKADNYPRELAVGEEGTVVLGITNQEHEPMSYKVEMMLGGALERTIGPFELDHGENIQEEVILTPYEACAHTELASTIKPGTDTYTRNASSIEVNSNEHFDPGDYIWIYGLTRATNERRQVETIDDNTIELNEPLKEFHLKGTTIIEFHQIDFLIQKTRQLNKSPEDLTTFTLWFGLENLDATITNNGQIEAEYQLKIKVKSEFGEADKSREKTKSFSTGPVILQTGKSWEPAFDYSQPEAIWQNAEVFLYRNRELIFHENALGGYPVLRLLIHATESE